LKLNSLGNIFKAKSNGHSIHGATATCITANPNVSLNEIKNINDNNIYLMGIHSNGDTILEGLSGTGYLTIAWDAQREDYQSVFYIDSIKQFN